MPRSSSASRTRSRWSTNWLNTSALCRLRSSSSTSSRKASSLLLGTPASGSTSAGLQQARRSRMISARIWICVWPAGTSSAGDGLQRLAGAAPRRSARSAVVELDQDGCSVRGGSSLSTAALVRRSRKGRTAPAAPGGRWASSSRSMGPAKRLLEALARAEQAGIDEAEQAPELAEVVLHRRAGQRQPELRPAAPRRLRPLGLRVLDRLRLVQHRHLPVPAGQQLRLLVQQAVAGTPARRTAPSPATRAARSPAATSDDVVSVGAKRASRSPSSRQTEVGATTRRAPAARAIQQQRERLQRLAQAHVVGQAGAGAPVRQPRQPGEALDLIVAQLGLQGRRQLRRPALGRLDARNLPLPGRVCLDLARLLQQGAQRRCAQRMHAAPGPCGFRHRGKPAAAGPATGGSARQSGHPPGVQTAPVARSSAIKQEAHVQHLLLVERDGAVHAEPVRDPEPPAAAACPARPG